MVSAAALDRAANLKENQRIPERNQRHQRNRDPAGRRLRQPDQPQPQPTSTGQRRTKAQPPSAKATIWDAATAKPPSL